MTRRRLTRVRRERLAVSVGAVAGVLVIAAVMVASVTVQNGVPGARAARLELEFADLGNVSRYDDVRIAGRLAGAVAAVRSERGLAIATIRLSGGLGGLRRSTRARVRSVGLVGAQYVELVPGTAGPPLRDGARIPASQTSANPDLLTVLRGFGEPRVRELRALARALGAGLAGRGERVNEAVAAAAPLLGDGARVLDELADRRPALRRLVPAGADLAAALAPSADELARGFAPAARGFRPLATRDEQVAALVRETAGAVREAPAELARARALMRETDRLAGAVARVTAVAPGAFRSATRLLRESPGPLRAAVPVVRRARGDIPPLLDMVARTTPLAEPFGRSLDSALPPVVELAKRVCDYDESFPWLRTVPAYGTPAAHEFGADTLIRVLSGGQGLHGEALGPEYAAFKLNGYDQDPPPCAANHQVFAKERAR